MRRSIAITAILLIGLVLPHDVVADQSFIVRVQIKPDQNIKVDKVEFIPVKGNRKPIEAIFTESSEDGKNLYKAELPNGAYNLKVVKPGFTSPSKTITIPNRLKETVVKIKPQNSLSSEAEKTTKPTFTKEALLTLLKKTRVTIEHILKMAITVPPEPGRLVVIFNFPPNKNSIEIEGKKYPIDVTNGDLAIVDVSKYSLGNAEERLVTCKLLDKEYQLKFIRVKVPVNNNVISLSLENEQANKFYRKSQELAGQSPLQPMIFKSVSDRNMPKVIPEFWIQSETIDNGLYNKIIKNGDVDKVSYNDAQKVITQLNDVCGGYKFGLPTEQQFVYLARKIYHPIKEEDLVACKALKDKEISQIKQLLGNKWQLTQSNCDSWSDNLDDSSRQCNPKSYVKKGGTTESRDVTECLPEYRAESTPDVSEPNTTIRLIILDEQKQKNI